MVASSEAFDIRLKTNAQEIEALLDALLSNDVREDEIARPESLRAAMHYAVLNGGKRLRPFLVVESALLLGGDKEAALRVGAALECIHCYSLVHDDLPAMDDDKLRRGKPTLHIAFDEATAILAGDSLLTYAFDIIAADETGLPEQSKVALVLALARSAGLGGMAGGQALDLAAEKNTPDERGIVTLQAMKTGALIRFACEAGAMIAGASSDDRKRLRAFGEKIGLAFQLADDLLDVTSDAATMGKATGKDVGRGKGTLVSLRGIGWAEAELRRHVEDATQLLEPYGDAAATLAATARFVAARKS
ncbi:polyprenyl synthetase family protein [Rhizobium sp. SEMIA 4085]|uniref:Probable farnesyl diphosphate synthase n=1 Tax=Rhizobium gallicum bv. gallicum R602sp TaxID=1041138 RepID=A0A0B4X9P0_9HYPH|nr:MULTISPECIES: farnesyl diphosphate synthase [Rhizobium]AJD43247.1 polyprenyl synthetase protein [Rhizobium gallicum bv. gallicum R602sp]NNH29274.1 polyprenyl synthetase family protein [Rhizobium sp. SEMIA 4085]TDW20128.1 farnesyl-diphosphate synthase [Rhizobium azibense]